MKKVLLIDDDIEMLKSFSQELEHAGYEVVAATNGIEGIKMYVEQPVDVVITDLFMPEKEGIETIKDLKAGFPDAKIIAISDKHILGHENYLEAAKCLGAQYTFSKPLGTKDLLKAIHVLSKTQAGEKS